MRTYDPNGMTGGWFIGDFEPSVWRTTAYEVGYKHHKAGESWPTHYHEHMDEVTFLLEGEMQICGEYLKGPVIFVLDRMEIADPVFLTDCKVFVVKSPSVPGDKVEINMESKR